MSHTNILQATCSDFSGLEEVNACFKHLASYSWFFFIYMAVYFVYSVLKKDLFFCVVTGWITKTKNVASGMTVHHSDKAKMVLKPRGARSRNL